MLAENRDDAKSVIRAVQNGADLKATITQKLSGKRVIIPKRKSLTDACPEEYVKSAPKVNFTFNFNMIWLLVLVFGY